MTTIDGRQYVSPLCYFDLTLKSDRELLRKWERHFSRLKIPILLRDVSSDKVEMLVENPTQAPSMISLSST